MLYQPLNNKLFLYQFRRRADQGACVYGGEYS
jgi:hypothetical protein